MSSISAVRPPDPILQTIKTKFFTALLSDSLDAAGYMSQALPPSIRPLDDSLVMVGRARTALFAEIEGRLPDDAEHYKLEIQFVDSLQTGDVAVFSCGSSGRIAPWGGLLSTASKVRGASGALMDGLVRDIRDIRAMQFPVYHGGIGPLDSKGRGMVVAIDEPIEVAGVRVETGDLIFGDADGCVVVPKSIEAKVLQIANDRLSGEKDTLTALRSGESLASVFQRFGIL